jgi:hypothetical protein
VEFGAAVWCPSCVADSSGKARRGDTDISRILYDTWALAIPFALLLIWPLTLLSAPAVTALAVMKWKQPLSLVRRNRWRFVAGLVAGIGEGALWVWFISYLLAKARHGA